MARDFDHVRHHLAFNIRTLRAALDVSQEQLALESDVDRTYVSQIERAVGNPSLLVLCKLGMALNADVGALLDAAPDASPQRRKRRGT